SEMYDCAYHVVLYINYASKGWNMWEEDYEKTPDIRAFCTRVTDEDKREVFRKAAEVTPAVRYGVPPKIDIVEFIFNNFKEACVKVLSDDEVEELCQQVEIAKGSTLPKWKVNGYVRALNEIEELRKGDA